MVDTKTPGDKTLSVPSKTLTLKPRVETGTVRQSFSHGRTKQVVVEKRGKRRLGGDAPVAPEPPCSRAGRRQGRARQGTRTSGREPAGRAAQQFRRRTAHADRGRAFRARQRAGRRQGSRRRGAEARGSGSQAPRQPRRHRTGRTRSRRGPPQGRRRTSPCGRRGQAQSRTRGQAALWRSRGEDRGGTGAHTRIRRQGAGRRRRGGGGRRPASGPARPRWRHPSRGSSQDHAQAGAAEAARPPDRRYPRSPPTTCASVQSPRSAAAPSV